MQDARPGPETRVNRFDDSFDDRQRPNDGAGEPRPGSRDLAVALSHDAAGSELPRVIASGKGAVARQLLEIAFARGIKVREDSDLAEVLSAVEIDTEIPMAAFAAVAEILSYIYRTQDNTRENLAARYTAAFHESSGDTP